MKTIFKRLITSTLLFFVAQTVVAQVGIGTTSPEASLEVKNSNNDTLIFKIKGNDLVDKLVVKENGNIMISEPDYDEYSEKFLTLDDSNIVRYRDIDDLKPTGLERINEGYGPGWRLISRNAEDFGPIGYQAVDFSLAAPSSNKGATGAFSLIGPGTNNYTTSSNYLNHVIIGGNNNFILEDTTSPNLFGVSILGGSSNDVYSNSVSRTFLHGNNNKFESKSYGVVIGSSNIIQTESNIRVIGDNNNISPKSKALIHGNFNTIDKQIIGTIIGDSNQIGNYTSSKGEHAGYVLGTNNINNSGKSFLFGEGNIGQQNGNKLYSFLIGTNNSNNQAFSSFLIGNDLTNKVPLHVILGQYNESIDSSHPLTAVDYQNTELPQSYYSATTDPVFTVGIGYKNQTGTIVRKDGLRVYRNGKVEVRQAPQTNNSLDRVYVRDFDGSFALRDANTLVSSSFSYNNDSGTIDSAYLNSNYASVSVGYHVYSEINNKIYIKVSGTGWISYNTNLLP